MGREREVAALGQALSQPPAVVLVEAEPGAGKSRLVQEFLAAPIGQRHRLLVAVCPPFREALTLGPIVDAVRQAREGVAGLPLTALAGALRPLLPEWADDLPPLPAPLDDAKAARHRLFRALAELIRAMGVTGVIVEDVHWADPVTMEFLLFLASHRASRQQAEPPSLLVTYRPADVPPGSLLLRLSSRLPVGTTQLRIGLAPLDVLQTAGMVSSMLGDEPVSMEFARFLHERTGGVPLAVEESVRLLRDRADLFRRNGEWVRRLLPDLQVSPTIRDSVLERVQRLTRPAQQVLQAAAVFAEPTPGDTVTVVAGVVGGPSRAVADPVPPAADPVSPASSEPMSAAISEAVASGLLREDERLRLTFRHAFMSQVVYEAIPGAERRRLHRLAGEQLERLDPPPVVALTRHFREANQVEKWSHFAEQAAERAVAGGDHTTATALLTELLHAADQLPPETQLRLARRLATIALGRREQVDELHQRVVAVLRRVVETGSLNDREQAQLRNPLGRLLAQQGDLAAAQTELERAIPHLGQDTAEAGRVMTYLGWPWLGPWGAQAHREWLRRAAALDHSRLSPVERTSLQADRAVALLQLGDDEGWQVASALPAVSESDSPALRRQRCRACLNFGTAATLWGLYDRARRWLAEGMALADAEHYPRIRSKIAFGEVELAWLSGHWQELEPQLTAVAHDEDTEPLVALNAARLLGWWHTVDGSLRRGEEYFTAAMRDARHFGAIEDELDLAAGLGRLRLAEGRVGEALAVTAAPLAPVVSKQVWLFATALAPVRVAALTTAGKLNEAVELVTAYEQGVRERPVPASLAGLATCQALLAEGQGAPAAARYAAAAEAWQRLPRPYEVLLAQERQARCLFAEGAEQSGQELLTRVWQGLAELGARADEERVGRQLREYGVDVRRPWRGGRRGYGTQPSPRELEVIKLVLAGKTNREIAQVLHKSPRTVAGQLASVMRKLGVSSRTELAVRVVEEGLVAESEARPTG
ncbi:helix-turn-helix transcriptional regulator [Natronosporangium hydrolyticum]|nr:AAA family ATPase [Natronosporangium hydrolyticum]